MPCVLGMSCLLLWENCGVWFGRACLLSRLFWVGGAWVSRRLLRTTEWAKPTRVLAVEAMTSTREVLRGRAVLAPQHENHRIP